MNANSFYRHFETRSGHVFNPEEPRDRFVSLQRPTMRYRRTFRIGGLVLQLVWDAGVFA